jgi:hypothetical protein
VATEAKSEMTNESVSAMSLEFMRETIR